MPSLLVLIPDRLSCLVSKGEITPRYYNPGDLFDDVHILICNDDRVEPSAVQHTVGKARLTIHNLPEEFRFWIQSTRFFRPWLLRRWARPVFRIACRHQFHLLRTWAQPAIALAEKIRPSLIRCHGNDYNAYVACCIKQVLKTPYVVSLHINPDVNPRRRSLNPQASWQQKLFDLFFDEIEKAGLRDADMVLPVYRPIVPYLERVGCRHYEVAYNVLSDHLQKKDSYALHHPVRILSVGRHFALKNPENLIRAVVGLPGVELTLVGDGAYQQQLENLVRDLRQTDRIFFRPAIANEELCRMLPEYDIFAVHTEHWEVGKAVLEALLTGLPVVINRRLGEPVPELEGDFVLHTVNTPEGYRQALQTLMEDDLRRERLGRAAYSHAQFHWAPAKTEAKYVDIYRQVMAKGDLS